VRFRSIRWRAELLASSPNGQRETYSHLAAARPDLNSPILNLTDKDLHAKALARNPQPGRTGDISV
jgi:hypothetical protein